ncbi:VanZ family protein [Aneurinibacillus aneurinilyticus]|uniref:VanZ family protein n=1 Tax=Aneurinibacillus aneurinilyticus TaxID=1391 RepID=UPI0023F8025A|nr:VanZ family protein [Aneurinibacillus aneurinilyticus]
MQKLKHIIILSFVFSMVIEILQYMTHLGQFDVDDIILNIVGSMIGFVFFLLTKKVFLLKIKKGAVQKVSES